MRVVQLIDSLDVGGAEKMAVNLANLFSEKAIPNLLIASRKGGPLEVLVRNKSSLILLSKKRTVDVVTFFVLLKKIKAFKPTILHAHDSSIFWAAFLGIFLPKTLVVWHAHYGGFASNNGRFGKHVKNIQRLIHRVVVVNSELLDWIKKELPGIPRSQFIGNFPEKISNEKIDRSRLNWIISVANLKNPKNHRTLILAFSQVVKTHPEFRLALIGTTSDGAYLQEVIKLIQAEKLEEKITITGAVISLKDWFDKAHFAVLSSDVEGLPVSVLELGLSGIPVLCSAVGACPELLGNGHFGYLSTPNDASSLTAQMNKIIENYEEAILKSEGFKEKVSAEFGADKFFEEYSVLINQE